MITAPKIDKPATKKANTALLRITSKGKLVVLVSVIKQTYSTTVEFVTFLENLTVRIPKRVGPEEVIKLYSFVKINGEVHFILPRGILCEMRRIGRVSNAIRRHESRPFDLIGALTSMQNLAASYLIDNIYSPGRRRDGTSIVLFDMRAGTGKTFLAAGLIARLGLPTLWVTLNKELQRQAIKDFAQIMPAGTAVAYDSKTLPIPTKNIRVIVIVVNSAMKLTRPYADQFGLAVFDEVHQYCAEKRKEIFTALSVECMFGMTASSDKRNGGLDIVMHRHFGRPVRAEDIPGFSYDTCSKWDCRAKIIKYYGLPEYTKALTHPSTDMIFVHYMHNQFIEDPQRLAIAVAELVALYDWRGDSGQMHHIYVFAEEKNILRIAQTAMLSALRARSRADICDACVFQDDINEIIIPARPNSETETGLFCGGRDGMARSTAEKTRVLFSTYGYGGTGISISHMTAMLLLTPRKSGFDQIFARIQREGSDVSIPRVVVDIVDCNTALYPQLRKRDIAYDQYGFSRRFVSHRAIVADAVDESYESGNI